MSYDLLKHCVTILFGVALYLSGPHAASAEIRAANERGQRRLLSGTTLCSVPGSRIPMSIHDVILFWYSTGISSGIQHTRNSCSVGMLAYLYMLRAGLVTGVLQPWGGWQLWTDLRCRTIVLTFRRSCLVLCLFLWYN